MHTVPCTKPMKTWWPGGPNSWKKDGSLAFTQASMTLVPSMVEVWCQLEPAGGTIWMPYLPGARFLISRVPSAPVLSVLSPRNSTSPAAL